MDECTATWVSSMIFDKLPTLSINIGSIIIDAHQATAITGNFIPLGPGTTPKTLQEGSCITAGGLQHRIVKFKVPIDGELYEFRGLITIANPNVITSGTFRSQGRGGGPDPGDTGTWEATRGGKRGGGKGGAQKRGTAAKKGRK